MWSRAPVVASATDNATPPNRMSATSRTIGPSWVTAVWTSSLSGRNTDAATASEPARPARPAWREGTRRANSARARMIGAVAAPDWRS